MTSGNIRYIASADAGCTRSGQQPQWQGYHQDVLRAHCRKARFDRFLFFGAEGG